MHWRGKAAVLKGHDVYHRTFFRNTALDFTDVDLRPITQDAVVAVVTIKVGDFTPPDGLAHRNSGPPIARHCQTFQWVADRARPQYRH